jgi:hypothetical protein
MPLDRGGSLPVPGGHRHTIHCLYDATIFWCSPGPFRRLAFILLLENQSVCNQIGPDTPHQFAVGLVDPMIQTGRCFIGSNRQHLLSNNRAGVNTFIKLKHGHASFVQSFDDCPGNGRTSPPLWEQGRVHTQNSSLWGLEHLSLRNLRPADNEQPVNLMSLYRFNRFGVVHFAYFDDLNVMLIAKIVHINTSRLATSKIVLQGYNTFQLTSDLIDFFHTRKTKLNTGNKCTFHCFLSSFLLS